MGKVVDLKQYKMKQLEKNIPVSYLGIELPQICITKCGKGKYNIIVNSLGEETLFNQIPIPKLSIAIYIASYCKDRLNDYFEEPLSTDIIVFDDECSIEMEMPLDADLD